MRYSLLKSDPAYRDDIDLFNVEIYVDDVRHDTEPYYVTIDVGKGWGLCYDPDHPDYEFEDQYMEVYADFKVVSTKDNVTPELFKVLGPDG